MATSSPTPTPTAPSAPPSQSPTHPPAAAHPPATGGTGTPPGTGTIDVTPQQLYSVSGQVASQQDVMHRGANTLLDDLGRHPDCGGYGTAARDLAGAYVKVGNKFLDVWGRSVASIGGAAVGFTTTANNYAKVDAATDPSGKPALHQAPPHVMDKAPSYRSVTDPKWNDVDDAQSFLQVLLEGLDGIALDVIEPELQNELNMGELATLFPLPDYQGLYALSQAWVGPSMTATVVDGSLTGLLMQITDQHNSEWYGAMSQFCGAIWGTTAWGKQREGYSWGHDTGSNPSHPILGVLNDTCKGVSDALLAFAEAAKDLRDKARSIYLDAVNAAIPNIHTGSKLKDVENVGKSLLGLGLHAAQGNVLNVDGGALDAAVAEYNTKVEAQKGVLDKLMPALEEAYLSAPTFTAEEARAEGFGARSLNDFKNNPLYTVPGDDESNHAYPVDLASQENMLGAHTLDKHVGKTDAQLAQRLRDQGTAPTATWPDGKPSIGAASTFATAGDAQKYTQYNVDQYSPQIKAWLESNPPDGDTKTLISTAPNNETVGVTVTKQPNGTPGTDFKTDGMKATSVPVHNVNTVIRYDSSVGPPHWVVLTSMPTNKPPSDSTL